MKKYKFILEALCRKEYILEGKDDNEVETKAIKHFKENICPYIVENDSYGTCFKEIKL